MKRFFLSSLILLCFLSYSYTQQYVNCHPDNSNMWTGSVGKVLFSYPVTDNELMVGIPQSRGWAKFNITGIPDNATIDNVEIDLFVYQASSTPASHELVLSSLYVDPVTASGNTLWNSIDDPPDYLEESTWGDADGQKFKSNLTTMINDIQSSLIKNWFAVGFYERNEDGAACYIIGHLSVNAPYLVISFSLPAPTNVVASDGTYCNNVRISWNAVSNADRYYIYRGTNSLGFTSNLYFDYSGASTSPEEYRVYASKSSIDNRFSSKYGSNTGYKKTIPSQPGTITGLNSVCQGSTQTYSILSVPGATSYTWTLPSGWSGSSTSTSISATAGTSSGAISVTANNVCGSSTPGTKSTVIASKPTITTSPVSTLSSSSASGGGNITSDGGAEVTASGVCWNTSPDPTTSNSKTNDGLTIGSFTSTMNGLSENLTYYVRAYATNCSGTGYGSNVEYNRSNAIEVIQFDKISVYPNPVSEILNIEYKNGNYKTINVINPQGILLKTEKVVLPSQQLNFSMYEPGLYILEFIKPGGEIESVRVVKH